MIDLTPLEVRKKKGDFRKAIRGYEPALVDDFLDIVADRVEQLVRDNISLKEQLAVVQQQVAETRERERALTDALVTAQEMREEMRKQTAREADLMRRTAEQETTQLRRETEQDVSEMRSSAERETAELRSNTEREVAELRSSAERETAELRASTERVAAELRMRAEREAAELRTRAEREAGRLRGDAIAAREREEELLRRLRARQQQLLQSYRTFLAREMAELQVIAESLEIDGAEFAAGGATAAAASTPGAAASGAGAAASGAGIVAGATATAAGAFGHAADDADRQERDRESDDLIESVFGVHESSDNAEEPSSDEPEAHADAPSGTLRVMGALEMEPLPPEDAEADLMFGQADLMFGTEELDMLPLIEDDEEPFAPEPVDEDDLLTVSGRAERSGTPAGGADLIDMNRVDLGTTVASSSGIGFDLEDQLAGETAVGSDADGFDDDMESPVELQDQLALRDGIEHDAVHYDELAFDDDAPHTIEHAAHEPIPSMADLVHDGDDLIGVDDGAVLEIGDPVLDRAIGAGDPGATLEFHNSEDDSSEGDVAYDFDDGPIEPELGAPDHDANALLENALKAGYRLGLDDEDDADLELLLDEAADESDADTGVAQRGWLDTIIDDEER